MTISETITAELQHEAENTKKYLAIIPNDKLSWQPHPKSMTLGQLTGHIVEMPLWIVSTVTTSELDFSTTDYEPFVPQSAEEILEKYEEYLSKAIEALKDKSDEHMMENWTMKSGEHIIFTLPRVVAIRSSILNHWYHHRGQMSVYLRINDIALPSIFGPTADEY